MMGPQVSFLLFPFNKYVRIEKYILRSKEVVFNE